MARRVTALKQDADNPHRENWARKKQRPTEVQRLRDYDRQLNELKRPDKDRQKITRPCMCCQKSFPSDGYHNRLCTECRTKDVGYDL